MKKDKEKQKHVSWSKEYTFGKYNVKLWDVVLYNYFDISYDINIGKL